jgi:hypothetical protein
MALPLIPVIAALIVGGIGGIASGVGGALTLQEANKIREEAKKYYDDAKNSFDDENETTTKILAALGRRELNVAASFGRFSKAFEKIKNKPEFSKVRLIDSFDIRFDPVGIEEVSVNAGSIVAGGIAAITSGVAVGFAAYGGAVALGTASAGAALAGLHGVAFTNALLAFFGGGSLAAGGLGMAGGTLILGGIAVAPVILVGGGIFLGIALNQKKKAQEAVDKANDAIKSINKSIDFFKEVRDCCEILTAAIK